MYGHFAYFTYVLLDKETEPVANVKVGHDDGQLGQREHEVGERVGGQVADRGPASSDKFISTIKIIDKNERICCKVESASKNKYFKDC